LVITTDNNTPPHKYRKTILTNRVFILLMVLIILATIGALSYVIIKPQASKPFTEFYLLDQDRKTKDYPTNLQLGEQGQVFVCIVNHEGKKVSYSIEVVMNGSKINNIGPFELTDKTSQSWQVNFVPDTLGNDQKVEFLLFKDGEFEPPSDSLYLWFNVSE
jgi:uncharacterized membrane protein